MRPLTLIVALLASLVLGGCTTGASAPPDELTVADAWVRPPMAADRPAAGYMTITNPGAEADALVGATTAVADMVEIHRTTTMSGMTGMEPVEAIHVPAGGTVTLEPGGFHLMLMGVDDLTPGDTVELELTFEKAGKVVVTAEVRNG
jgi:copper(I)-binding protein